MRKKSSKSYKPLSERNLKLLQGYQDANKLTKKDLASELGINILTLKRALTRKPLFRKIRNKIGLFIKNQKLAEDSVEGLKRQGAEKISTSPRPLKQEIVLRVLNFMSLTGLPQQEVAKMLGLKRSTFQDAISGKKNVSFKTRQKLGHFAKKLKNLDKLSESPQVKESEISTSENFEQAIERIKYLLLALELDLRLFRNSEKARTVFRTLLDAGDVGFVGTLLTQLTGDEKQFKRWVRFNNYQFNSFRRKG